MSLQASMSLWSSICGTDKKALETTNIRAQNCNSYRQYGLRDHKALFENKLWFTLFTKIERVTMPVRGGDVLKKLREMYWVYTLNTVIPNGLNDDYSLKCF